MSKNGIKKGNIERPLADLWKPENKNQFRWSDVPIGKWFGFVVKEKTTTQFDSLNFKFKKVAKFLQ